LTPSSASVGGSVLVVACVVACGAPVGVRHVSPRAAHEALTGSVLTGGRPSEGSRNTLRHYDLLAAFDRDPGVFP
jgi:hypothetical protein